MNKAQDILEKVKRYQFWILCGLVTLIGVGSWWMATSSLADTYAKNKTKIESEAARIGTVQGHNPHPNKLWNEQIIELVKHDRDEVAKAWQRLYSEQEAKVYVWPKDIFGPGFVAAAEPLASSLRATGAPVGELNTVQRGLYQAEVLRQFRELATLLDAEYVDPTQTTGGLGGDRYGGAATVELQPGQTPRKVIWSGQAELQQPFIWEQRPTTLGVLYAQEEFWVIKAICNAIAEANKDSAGAHDAAVRAILAMSVGYEAAEEFPGGANEPGRITRVTPVASPTTGYGGAGGGYGGAGADGGSAAADGGAATGGGGGLPRPVRTDRKSSGGGGGAGYGGVGGESATAAVVSTNPAEYLNDWRYVNGNGKPLGFAELATPQFYEYRLMPWRVTMTVDQRKWDELLVMFRNTDLPLEIRQVRLNPVTDAASGGGRYGTSEGGSGGGGYGGTSRGGGGYGAAAGGRYGADGGAGAFGLTAQPIQETATLELRGFAYLLNPPDLEKIGKSGTAAAVDVGAPATESASTSEATPAVAPTDENPFGTPAVISPPAQSGPAPGAGGGR